MASASPLVQMVKTWEPEEVTSNQPWTPSSPTPHEAHRRLSLRKSLETYQEHILLGGGGQCPILQAPTSSKRSAWNTAPTPHAEHPDKGLPRHRRQNSPGARLQALLRMSLSSSGRPHQELTS